MLGDAAGSGDRDQLRGVRYAELEAALVSALVSRARFIALVAIGFAGLAGALRLLEPRMFTSSVAFTPESRRPSAMAGLSGVAAQFGIAVPSPEPGANPQFYAYLVRTPRVMRAVAEQSYTFRRGDGDTSGTLMDFLRIRGSSQEVRLARTVRRLGQRIGSSANARTGVVSVSVQLADARVSRAVAERLVVEVERYNKSTRQSATRAEREFTEERTRDAKSELRAAEDSLERFAERNRGFSSPLLTFQQGRLTREVTAKAQVLAVVSQAYEQARIEELRDAQLITIIEPPLEAALPDPRGLVSGAILGGLAGLVLGALAVILQFWLGNQRARRAKLADGSSAALRV